MYALACGSGSRLYILDDVIIWYWKIPSFESGLCTRTSNGNVGHRGGSMSKGFTGSIWQPALGEGTVRMPFLSTASRSSFSVAELCVSESEQCKNSLHFLPAAEGVGCLWQRFVQARQQSL